MDSRFTPRSQEELMKAVNSLRAHQKAMNERLKAKLEKEVFQQEFA